MDVADGSADFPISADFPMPVGDRLRAARLEQGLSLDDIASQTRVPLRHLEAIERSAWDDLPAPTYSIGFARAYAEIVGLDRKEIGDELRIELGGGRAATTVTETFQPADPARVPPRTLAVATVLIGAALLAGFGYYRTVALGDVQPQIVEMVDTPAPGTIPVGASGEGTEQARPPRVIGPVVITASEPVWIKVYERGGADLFEDTMTAGQSYTVPANAVDPLLRTGRAELLRVTVAGDAAPPIGPASSLVKDVSLKAAMLMTAPAAQ